MSRLAATFTQFSRQNRTALIPFITAGDPNPEFTVPMMHAMVKAGADIIELGVPFSDPMADGPVIQRASERALGFRVSVKDVIDMAVEFRRNDADTPIVLMGYLNPIEHLGYSRFVELASNADIDGVLTVDMPPEEASVLLGLLNQADMDPIFLLAPNSSEARIKKICSVCKGYLYYVSLKGITGASHLVLSGVAEKLREIRSLTKLPVGVGFGVKNAQTAGAICQYADAVVVGSAIISQIESNLDQPDLIKTRIIELLESMRNAMDF